MLQVIVLCDSTLDEQLLIGDYAHENDKRFIVADTKGLFAEIFCDFGESFTVYDTNGEQPLSIMISAITKNVSTGVVFSCYQKALKNLVLVCLCKPSTIVTCSAVR